MERHRLDSPARKAGRPRSEEAHAAILGASIQLIREAGYEALTMDAIAARAGVGKATVYRRWKSKEFLVAEALERLMLGIQVPDTGDVRSDVLAVMQTNLTLYRDPATTGLLASLVAAMVRSAPIAKALRGGFISARRKALHAVLSRGVRRGEVRPDTDLQVAVDVLSAPLFFRALATGGRVDQPLISKTVAMVLRGISAHRR